MEDVLSPYLNMPEAHVSLAVSALLKKDVVAVEMKQQEYAGLTKRNIFLCCSLPMSRRI